MEDLTFMITLITIFFIGYFWGRSKTVKTESKDAIYQERFNQGYIKGYVDASNKMMQIIDDESDKQIKKEKPYYKNFPEMGIN